MFQPYPGPGSTWPWGEKGKAIEWLGKGYEERSLQGTMSTVLQASRCRTALLPLWTG